MTESKFVTLRVPEELVDPINRAARDETRNRSQQILHWIRESLRREGRLPEPTAPGR